MGRTLLLVAAWGLAGPCFAQEAAPSGPRGPNVKLIAYDRDGRVMDLPGFLAFIGRADRKASASQVSGLWVTAPDGLGGHAPRLDQGGSLLTAEWSGLPRVQISLPWPIEDDGFSTAWMDHGGSGFADGDVVYVNEEIAVTQYRLFREAWVKHVKDMIPAYEPGSKAEKLAAKAQKLMAKAQKERGGPERAAAYDAALREIALAWQKMLFEHGLQIAHNSRVKGALRFGLTLDEGILARLDHYKWVVEMVQRSGANWVRLVFKGNAADFAYSKESSFSEYDGIVKALRAANIRVMGCSLATTQWPATLTPETYSERVKNLVLHYRGLINSWEVGNEINGDWLGGTRTPIPAERVFQIYSAAAAKVKSLEPGLETVATLYWWDGTAPDDEHSLFGWLSTYVPKGFGRNLDVVALSLQPEDNPVGLAFERVFERVSRYLPDKKLMVGSIGYVEGDSLKGYWWLDPKDVDGARKDLAILYTTASCAVPRSLCGGFWWQTLDQMMPARHKETDLYRVYGQTLEQLGR